MRIVPVIRCSDLERSLAFYTQVLDFEPMVAGDSGPVVDLVRDGAGLQLSTLPGDGVFGAAANVHVEEVDDLFEQYLSRGLDVSGHPGSPVHEGPVDQTWGRREFYVTDPDGNTLRFGRWAARR